MHKRQIQNLDSQATFITVVINVFHALCDNAFMAVLAWGEKCVVETLLYPWRGSRRVARQGERLNVKMSLCEDGEFDHGPKPALASEGL
jgi:hypothetical protein